MEWETAKQIIAERNGYRDFTNLEWNSDRGGVELDTAYREVAEFMVLQVQRRIDSAMEYLTYKSPN